MAVRSIGRYEVVRLLGTGGFATVYLARDDRLEADVAVKVLAENWSNDDEITRRFVEEARLLRRCDDDRVVRVHTIEELDDGRPYFVMDYADAGTLADRMLARLDEGRPYKVREAVDLSSELADCLTVVHDCGIVHRDLKPTNVLFRTSRAGERMVLGDFGLARQLLTATGRTILAGTPEYVAPEQADPALASSVDERADVYAAAVMLYELVAGAVPFDYSSLDQAASARRLPPDLAAVRPDVPPELAALVARGMATDPGARFPTGRAWLAALRALAPVVPSDAPGPAGGPDGAAAVGGALPGAALSGGAAPGAAPIAAGVVRAGTAADGRAATPPDRPVPPRPVPPGPVPPGPGPAPALAGDDEVPRDHRSGIGPGSPAGGPPPPAGTPPAPGGRKAMWPLFAGVLAALAVIVAIAVIVGRSGGSSPSAVEPTLPPAPAPASSVPGSTAPSAAPPTTAAPVPTAPLSGAAAWFAAASGPTCRPAVAAEKLPGTVSAVTCTYPGVVAVFAQVGSPVDAELFLARLRRNHTGATAETWASGRAVLYGSAAQPAIGWDYAGEPYAALALSNNRATLSSWWVATGRVERTTA